MAQQDTQVTKIDLLYRGSFVHRMMDIVNILSEGKKSYCYAINGVWGSGKSFVLDEFEKRSNAPDKFFYIRYNCWEYDYYEEPLLSLVSVMLETIEAGNEKLIKPETKTKLKTIAKKLALPTLAVLAGILKHTTGIDLKNLGWLLNLFGIKPPKGQNGDETDKGQKGDETDLGAIAEKVSEAMEAGGDAAAKAHEYDPHFQFKQIKDELRDAIREIAEKKTILIVVDELDRCLPEYAIKVLERLHHVTTGIGNVQVILAVDRNQLEHTVSGIYGPDTDARAYLEKFIQFELELDRGVTSSKISKVYEDYYRCFSCKEGDEERRNLIIAVLLQDIDIRTVKTVMDKSQLCHNMLSDGTVTSDYRQCAEIFLTLLRHYGFDRRKARDRFDMDHLFDPERIFSDAANKKPGNTKIPGLEPLAKIINPSRQPDRYYQKRTLGFEISAHDPYGYLLAVYRTVLGFRALRYEVLGYEGMSGHTFVPSFYDTVHTEKIGLNWEEECEWIIKFWRLLEILN